MLYLQSTLRKTTSVIQVVIAQAFLSQQEQQCSWRDNLYGVPIWIANLKALGES